MCCSDEFVEFFRERFPECAAYALEIRRVLTKALGAIGREYPVNLNQEHPVNIVGKNRPISEELIQFPSRGGPVPARGGAPTIDGGIETIFFTLKGCLVWPS